LEPAHDEDRLLVVAGRRRRHRLPGGRMRARGWWLRLKAWFLRPVPMVAIIILYAASVAGFGFTAANSRADCRSRQESRQAVREIGLTLRTLVESTGNASTDFSQVAGYDELDPSFRSFLAGLQASGGGTDWQSSALRTIEESLDKLPPLVCS
jgi:hypothetical protein